MNRTLKLPTKSKMYVIGALLLLAEHETTGAWLSLSEEKAGLLRMSRRNSSSSSPISYLQTHTLYLSIHIFIYMIIITLYIYYYYLVKSPILPWIWLLHSVFPSTKKTLPNWLMTLIMSCEPPHLNNNNNFQLLSPIHCNFLLFTTTNTNHLLLSFLPFTNCMWIFIIYRYLVINIQINVMHLIFYNQIRLQFF